MEWFVQYRFLNLLDGSRRLAKTTNDHWDDQENSHPSESDFFIIHLLASFWNCFERSLHLQQ